MSKIERNETFLVATHNKGKATEFRELFQRINVSTKFSFELNIKEPQISGGSYFSYPNKKIMKNFFDSGGKIITLKDIVS